MPLLKTHSEFINVDKLKENEIFVFGSNEAGIHGAGAAKLARKVGAKLGVGVGLSGNSYAIPTKDRNIVSLELNQIQEYVIDFLKFVEDNLIQSKMDIDKKAKIFVKTAVVIIILLVIAAVIGLIIWVDSNYGEEINKWLRMPISEMRLIDLFILAFFAGSFLRPTINNKIINNEND